LTNHPRPRFSRLLAELTKDAGKRNHLYLFDLLKSGEPLSNATPLDGRFFIFQNRPDRRIDLWALPEERSFRWRKGDDKSIQLTAGPLNSEDPLPSKDGKQIFAIGDSHRAEVIRYDSGSGQFVPYLSGISAEGLAFSRDGQWVTYTSYPDGTLWRSKVDGSERLQLTFPPMRVLLPRWSPEGKQIAFHAILPGENWNVYLVSGEGGTPQRVGSAAATARKEG
jgi:hypothetical protein